LQIDFDSGDVIAIELLGTWEKLIILNLYNNCDHDTTIDLIKNFQRNLDDNDQVIPNEEVHMIWLEDFNRHHSHWDNALDGRLFTNEAI